MNLRWLWISPSVLGYILAAGVIFFFFILLIAALILLFNCFGLHTMMRFRFLFSLLVCYCFFCIFRFFPPPFFNPPPSPLKQKRMLEIDHKLVMLSGIEISIEIVISDCCFKRFLVESAFVLYSLPFFPELQLFPFLVIFGVRILFDSLSAVWKLREQLRYSIYHSIGFF